MLLMIIDYKDKKKIIIYAVLGTILSMLTLFYLDNIKIIEDEVVDFCVDNFGISSAILGSGATLGAGALIVCSAPF